MVADGAEGEGEVEGLRILGGGLGAGGSEFKGKKGRVWRSRLSDISCNNFNTHCCVNHN